MKIYLLGRGHRLRQIQEALALSKLNARLVQDPVRFDPPVDPGDLVIVAEFGAAELKTILDSLAAQNPPATVMIFTPLPSKPLARAYPKFLFRDEGIIYRDEIRRLQQRAAGQQQVEAVRKAVRGKALLTVIWGNPDPDAIASAYALQELVRADAKESTIAYMGTFTRPENAAMVHVLRIPTIQFSPDLVTPDTVVATVDAQPSFFPAEGRLPFKIVIDHHPLTDLGTPEFADVRPTYGATSTILTEYYQAADVRLSKRVASALFYGLKIDTGNLTRNVSDADVTAFRYLRVRADENMLRTIELSQLPVETLDYFAAAIARKRIAKDVAFAWLGTIPNADMCVYVADLFIKLANIFWAVVACRHAERVVVIFRSDGIRRHSGQTAEALFSAYGAAGGHKTMGRAEFDVAKLAAEVPDPSDAAVEAWLLRRLSTRLKPLSNE